VRIRGTADGTRVSLHSTMTGTGSQAICLPGTDFLGTKKSWPDRWEGSVYINGFSFRLFRFIYLFIYFTLSRARTNCVDVVVSMTDQR